MSQARRSRLFPAGKLVGAGFWLASGVAPGVSGCGSIASDPGSETHWLQACTSDLGCGLGSCHCGICTEICTDDDACHVEGEPAAGVCVRREQSGLDCAQTSLVRSAQICVPRPISAPNEGGFGAEGSPDAGGSSAGSGGGHAPTTGGQGGEPSAGTGGQGGEPGTGTGGQGNAGEGTAGGGGGSAPTCYPAVAQPVAVEDPESGSRYPAFAWSGSGVVGVAPGADSRGYRIVQLTANGEADGSGVTLWPEEAPPTEPTLAVSGDVLAIVDRTQEEETQRQICRIALARLGEVSTILPPSRFSDPPNRETVLNEAAACAVTAVTEGFVVFWAEMTSDTAEEWTLFAQSLDPDGATRGEPLTLVSGDKRAWVFSVASSGSTAVAALGPDADGQVTLGFIEDETVDTTVLDARITGSGVPVTLTPARGGFLARTDEALAVLDAEGDLAAGPLAVESTALVAPLGAGYIIASKEEYLVVRTVDAALASLSTPSAVSDDRGAFGSQIVYAPDGSGVALIYSDEGQLHLARLECTEEVPTSPGPASCPVEDGVAPLEDGCSDPVCHTVVRLDYLTLGLRGWTVVGGPRTPVDATGATEAARSVFEANSEYLSSSLTVSGPEAGLFTVLAPPSDFGAFAVVGEESGLVVASGGVVWGGTGQYWSPATWNDPGEIACDPSETVEPTARYLDPSSCDSEEGGGEAGAADALELVLRSNLAAHVASEGSFAAFTYLYTPTVGSCNPDQAEYLVVLTRAE